MADRRQRKTRLIAASAMLSALGVVLIAAAALLDVLDLTMAALASLLTVFAVIEIGLFYPWLIFAVTGILSLILLPKNTGAYCYILFFGYYPMIKSVFERKLPKPLAWLCKFLVFNLGFSGYVFLLPILITNEPFPGGWYIAAMYGGGNLLMLLYDLAMTKLITLYLIRLRDRLHISRWFR